MPFNKLHFTAVMVGIIFALALSYTGRRQAIQEIIHANLGEEYYSFLGILIWPYMVGNEICRNIKKQL